MTALTPGDLAIVKRDWKFGRDNPNPRWWHSGDPGRTAFFNALSSTFPLGEKFFMTAVRHYRDGTPEPLRSQIDDFIYQESMHSREHVVFNRQAQDAGFDIAPLEERTRRTIAFAKRRSPLQQLAATCALEHFTATLAHDALANPTHLSGVTSEAQRMWRWHAIEEIEHKGVAYDTWLHATKDWSRFRRWRAKSIMMLLVTSRFWPKRVKGMKALLRQDGLTGWRVTLRIWWYLLGKPGVLRKSFLPWLSYFLPGFHPWNHDDRALIKLYESDYADAVMPQHSSASAPVREELAAAAA